MTDLTEYKKKHLVSDKSWLIIVDSKKSAIILSLSGGVFMHRQDIYIYGKNIMTFFKEPTG